VEADRPVAARHPMSSSVTALVCIGAALVLTASPAWAVCSGEGVRSGADGYTSWGNSPTDVPADRATGNSRAAPREGLGLPCHADGMGACVVPVCGEPLAAGVCRMPTVTITVTAFRPTSATPHGVVTAAAGAQRGDGRDRTRPGKHTATTSALRAVAWSEAGQTFCSEER
jgi:hypothetical protein